MQVTQPGYGRRRKLKANAIAVLSLGAALILGGETATAAPIIDVGDHELIAAQSEHEIELFVDDVDGPTEVLGLELNVQVGDGGEAVGGTDTAPTITDLDLTTGTIFDDPSAEQADVEEHPLTRQSTVDVASPTIADGRIATISLDITGTSIGDVFDLRLADTASGFDTTLFDPDAQAIAPQITNGSISIVETPTFTTWLGGDGVWSDAGQWEDGLVPTLDVAERTLVFDGDGGTSVADEGDYENIDGLRFADDAGAFTLAGGRLGFNAGATIANKSANAQAITNALELPADTLTLGGSAPMTLSGEITGDGGLTVAADDADVVVELQSGDNAYAGATTIQRGTLLTHNDAVPETGAVDLSGGGNATWRLADDETIGSLSGTTGSVVDLGASTLTVGDDSDTTFAGSLTNEAGSLHKQGAGTLHLSGQSDYIGPTHVADGTLVVEGRDDNLADETLLSVTEGASFELDDGDETVGALASQADDNDNNNAEGDGQIQLNDNDLTLAGVADSRFAGQITGDGGGMRFDGTDAITHDLRDATLEYTGGNTFLGNAQVLFPVDPDEQREILAGGMTIQGSYISDAIIEGDVDNFGHFGGNPLVRGQLFNRDGATLAPGSSIGTVTVEGDFTAEAGSIFAVEVDGAGSEDGTHEDTQSDLLKVNATNDDGTATFEAASRIEVRRLDDPDAEPIRDGNVFLVVDAEGGIDFSDEVELNATSPFVELAAGLDNDDRWLLLTASVEAAFGELAEGADRNTRRIAAGLDSLFEVDPGDELIEQLRDLLEQVDEDQRAAVFQAAAPNVGPAAYEAAMPVTVENASVLHATMSRHFAARRRGLPQAVAAGPDAAGFSPVLASAGHDPVLLAEAIESQNGGNNQDNGNDRNDERPANGEPVDAADDDRAEHGWNFIGQAVGIFENQEHSSDVQGYRNNAFGVLLGADRRVMEDLDVGLSFSYLRSDVDFKAGRGSQDIDTFRIGPYVSYTPEPWFVDASLTYGHHRFDTTRRNPDTSTRATSSHNANDVSVYAGGGWTFEVLEELELTPIGSLQYTHLSEDSFRESGPGAMRVGSRSGDSLRSRLGVQATYVFEGEITLVPEATIGWEREWLSQDHTRRARFVAGGDTFSTRAGEPAENAAFLGLGVSALFTEQISAFLRYDGLYYGNSQAHAFIGGATYRF